MADLIAKISEPNEGTSNESSNVENHCGLDTISQMSKSKSTECRSSILGSVDKHLSVGDNVQLFSEVMRNASAEQDGGSHISELTDRATDSNASINGIFWKQATKGLSMNRTVGRRTRFLAEDDDNASEVSAGLPSALLQDLAEVNNGSFNLEKRVPASMQKSLLVGPSLRHLSVLKQMNAVFESELYAELQNKVQNMNKAVDEEYVFAPKESDFIKIQNLDLIEQQKEEKFQNTMAAKSKLLCASAFNMEVDETETDPELAFQQFTGTIISAHEDFSDSVWHTKPSVEFLHGIRNFGFEEPQDKFQRLRNQIPTAIKDVNEFLHHMALVQSDISNGNQTAAEIILNLKSELKVSMNDLSSKVEAFVVEDPHLQSLLLKGEGAVNLKVKDVELYDEFANYTNWPLARIAADVKSQLTHGREKNTRGSFSRSSCPKKVEISRSQIRSCGIMKIVARIQDAEKRTARLETFLNNINDPTADEMFVTSSGLKQLNVSEKNNEQKDKMEQNSETSQRTISDLLHDFYPFLLFLYEEDWLRNYEAKVRILQIQLGLEYERSSAHSQQQQRQKNRYSDKNLENVEGLDDLNPDKIVFRIDEDIRDGQELIEQFKNAVSGLKNVQTTFKPVLELLERLKACEDMSGAAVSDIKDLNLVLHKISSNLNAQTKPKTPGIPMAVASLTKYDGTGICTQN